MEILHDIAFDFKNKPSKELYLLVRELMQKRERTAARSLLLMALKYYYQHGKTHFLLSRTYRNKDTEKEIFHLEECIKHSPKHQEALLALAAHRPEKCFDAMVAAHQIGVLGRLEVSHDLYRRLADLQLEKKLVNKTTIAQHFINTHQLDNYWEINTFVGLNFLQIKAKQKVAIDEHMRIPHWQKNTDTSVHYFRSKVTDFFNSSNDLLQQEAINICLINRMNNFKQALQAVQQVMQYANSQSIILLSNCIPPNPSAAQTSLLKAYQTGQYEGIWTGDVFKVVLWIRTFLQDWQVECLPCDEGLAIIKKGENKQALALTEDQIRNMTFEELMKHKTDWLNLKSIEAFTW